MGSIALKVATTVGSFLSCGRDFRTHFADACDEVHVISSRYDFKGKQSYMRTDPSEMAGELIFHRFHHNPRLLLRRQARHQARKHESSSAANRARSSLGGRHRESRAYQHALCRARENSLSKGALRTATPIVPVYQRDMPASETGGR
jgi:hypothetical protein